MNLIGLNWFSKNIVIIYGSEESIRTSKDITFTKIQKSILLIWGLIFTFIVKYY